ncbi:MAG TPA: transposase, partial [Pyrinomonadaceae bacterium]|nr:transposase [Pyrinomonadaceae bacterium]
KTCNQFKLKTLGLKITAAFSDYSPSFIEAIKAVYPQARFQADHFHTVKNIWGKLKKSLLSSRRRVKASGEENNDQAFMALAQKLWGSSTSNRGPHTTAQ